MSEKGKITRGRLGSLSLKKEGERQCFLFSKHLIICTRGSGGKLHLTKVSQCCWASSGAATPYIRHHVLHHCKEKKKRELSANLMMDELTEDESYRNGDVTADWCQYYSVLQKTINWTLTWHQKACVHITVKLRYSCGMFSTRLLINALSNETSSFICILNSVSLIEEGRRNWN